MTQIDDQAGTPASTEQAEGLEVRIARQLLEQAKTEGVSLVGPGGLLAGVTKTVLQAALDAEMADHLGYERGDRPPFPAGNHRNGTSPKTVLTEVGPIPLEVPRDRSGKSDPQIVPKHARRVAGFNEAIVSLRPRQARPDQLEVAALDRRRHLVRRVPGHPNPFTPGFATTNGNRRVYPVLLIDAIFVKIRDGQVANRPVYVALGINCHGQRDVLGMWAGTGGEGAKAWMGILAELRNRGVEDCCIVACDGLKGLPEAIGEIWPRATVQLCVVHLVRASLRYASRKYWGQISKDLREVYTAPTQAAAEQRFAEFEQAWGQRYPAIIRQWRNAWEQFIPFLAFPPEIRKIIYTTNAIESLNSRFRQACRRRRHFPDDQAALKVLYLVIRTPQKNRTNVTGGTPGWKEAINALTMYYGDRITLN